MTYDTTIVYYTANHETPIFEKYITDALIDMAHDIPIISVSQKPMTIGKNICIGDVGITIHNAFRQLQIGVQAATTKFITIAESDYLYSPEYFKFIPPQEDIFYTPRPIYFLSLQHNRSRTYRLKPWGCDGAAIVGKEFLMKRLESILPDTPIWSPLSSDILAIFRRNEKRRIQFDTAIPTIMLKTNAAMSRKDTHSSVKLTTLPYWGDAEKLLKNISG